MRRTLVAVLFVTCLAVTLCAAQDAGDPPPPQPKPPAGLPIDAPDGWRKETIPLPPGFAPEMTLRGVEELRFHPDMFKPETDGFFSYVFAMRVATKPKLTKELLHKELLVYYEGLARLVLEQKGAKLEKKPTLTLEKGKKASTEDPAPDDEFYAGRLVWIEPFATQKEQLLHLELDVWASKDGKHQFLFVSASPAEKKAAVWKTMRAIRKSFKTAHGTTSKSASN